MVTKKRTAKSTINVGLQAKIKAPIKTKISPRKKVVSTLLLILTILCFLVTVFPFFIVVINAAKASLEIMMNPIAMPTNFITQLGKNIVTIWSKPTVRYPSSVFSSVIITVGSLAGITVFSSMAAWVLVRTKTKTSALLLLLFIGGLIIPFQVVMFPLVQLFSQINKVLGLRMLRTYHGMIFAYIGFGAPLSVFMFHGFIKSIPYELEEAATIGGYSKPQIFFKIVLPILQPIIVTVLILNGIWIWNDFLLPSLILGIGNEIQTIPLAIRGFAGSFVKKWDLIMAAVLMAALPIIIAFIFGQKYIIKGMVAGSIK